MDDKVKIILDNHEYELAYNEQTGYYEGDLVAPKTTGLHVVEVEFTAQNEIATANVDLIVLKKEEKASHIKEVVAYFLDKKTLEIIDITQLSIEEINIDLETNGKSMFTLPKKLNVEEDDFIFLKKEDKINFLGVVDSQDFSRDNVYTLTCKDILSLFDVKMFVENETVLKTIGIEDFIVQAIDREFIHNSDQLINRSYLSIEALTHNPKNIQISSIANITNDTYNLLTFINNVIEKYDIQVNFQLSKQMLNIQVFTKDKKEILIDTTTSDITDYSEVFSLSYIAKVEIRNKENNNIYYRYLLNDRTTTTDVNHPDRVCGKIEKIMVEKEEESVQRALDIFKSNSYNHNITFNINKKSKFHDIGNMKLGAPILVKTQNNDTLKTYISKIKDDEEDFLTITCGNLRIDYIDKVLQERRKLL